jgi:hypothetical protein
MGIYASKKYRVFRGAINLIFRRRDTHIFLGMTKTYLERSGTSEETVDQTVGAIEEYSRRKVAAQNASA